MIIFCIFLKRIFRGLRSHNIISSLQKYWHKNELSTIFVFELAWVSEFRPIVRLPPDQVKLRVYFWLTFESTEFLHYILVEVITSRSEGNFGVAERFPKLNIKAGWKLFGLSSAGWVGKWASFHYILFWLNWIKYKFN